MDSTTVPPSFASSLPDNHLQQTTDIQTLFQLIAALANVTSRQQAARSLAQYLGAEDLLIFLLDVEVGVLLPAPGLKQTLPDGRRWQTFLASCTTERPTHASLPFPDPAVMTEAVGLVGGNETVLVLFGGTPRLAEALLLVTLLPLLEAAFRREQARLLAEAEAEIARKTAAESQILISMLDATKQEVQNELHARHQVEEALRQSTALLHQDRERLFALFMQAPAAVLILRGPTYQIELANPITLTILGKTSEEVMNKPFFEVLPEGRERLGPLLDGVLATGIPYVAKALNVPLDRAGNGKLEDSYFTFVYAPLRGVTQAIEGVMVFAYEVTEQVVARQRVEESEARWRFMAESMPQKIFTARPNGDIDYFNSQWMEFTGLSFEQIKDWGWTQFIHPDDVEENVRRWQHSIETGEPFYFEHRCRRADGVYRWHVSRAIAMRNEEGQIMMWIGSNTDITEQKDLEREKEVFLSMATHELKTPLTSLRGFLQLAERKLQRLQSGLDLPQTEQQKFLDGALLMLSRSQQQVNVQNRLITDMLDVSRIQENALELLLAPCDLGRLVRETVQGYQAAYPQRQITLDLPEQEVLLIHADQDRIVQVLSNYVTNALKYSVADKVVQVGITCEPTLARIWVVDQGPGLSLEAQQHIWERFYRAPGIEEQNRTGVSLGLGLFICQGIISSHHGQVGVESTLGQGSRFWFTLPLLPVPEEV